MVHAYIYLPNNVTVAVDAGSRLLLKVVVPDPKNCDHAPVPTVGVLPPRLLLVRPQILWLGPVVAVVVES